MSILKLAFPCVDFVLSVSQQGLITTATIYVVIRETSKKAKVKTLTDQSRTALQQFVVEGRWSRLQLSLHASQAFRALLLVFLSATASYRLICWCLSFVCGIYSFGGDNFECSQPGRKPRNFSYLGCKLVTHKKFFIHALRIKFCKFLSFEGKCVSMSAPVFPSFSPSSTISSTCC